MRTNSSGGYETPEVTEYGAVESLTLEDKCGTGTDQYSAGTSLTGSVVSDGHC